jgi:hypothetical protein
MGTNFDIVIAIWVFCVLPLAFGSLSRKIAKIEHRLEVLLQERDDVTDRPDAV